MGCAAPTYRVEARIIKATGNLPTCGSMVGIDEMECAQYTKFIATAPTTAAPATKKRSVEEETIEAVLVAREAIAAWNPALYASIDFKDAPVRVESAKRAGILDQLQICSALINLGITALVSQFKVDLPIDLTTLLGPCGIICNYAVCGANIICPAQATPLLNFVNAQRISGSSGTVCQALTCASFSNGKESAGRCSCCCRHSSSTSSSSSSLIGRSQRPRACAKTRRATMRPVNGCRATLAPRPTACRRRPLRRRRAPRCRPAAKPAPVSARASSCRVVPRCRAAYSTQQNRRRADVCNGVRCELTIDKCATGTWPFCYDATLNKNDPYDCCPSCNDP